MGSLGAPDCLATRSPPLLRSSPKNLRNPKNLRFLGFLGFLGLLRKRAGLAPSLCGVPCSVQEQHQNPSLITSSFIPKLHTLSRKFICIVKVCQCNLFNPKFLLKFMTTAFYFLIPFLLFIWSWFFYRYFIISFLN